MSIIFPFSVFSLDEPVSFLGRGTFGDVFLMTHNINLKQYAVKRIPKQLINVNDTQPNQWKVDAAHAADLKHPSLIPPVDFYSDKYHSYFVYDYQENGTLKQYLENAKSIPEDYRLNVRFSLICHLLFTSLCK